MKSEKTCLPPYFLPSFHESLLSTYSTGATAVKQTDKNPSPHGARTSEERQTTNTAEWVVYALTSVGSLPAPGSCPIQRGALWKGSRLPRISSAPSMCLYPFAFWKGDLNTLLDVGPLRGGRWE